MTEILNDAKEHETMRSWFLRAVLAEKATLTIDDSEIDWLRIASVFVTADFPAPFSTAAGSSAR